MSCDFLNLLESIIRATELSREGTRFFKSVQLLAFADDNNIIGLSAVGSHVTVGSHNFEVVINFIFLGTPTKMSA